MSGAWQNQPPAIFNPGQDPILLGEKTRTKRKEDDMKSQSTPHVEQDYHDHLKPTADSFDILWSCAAGSLNEQFGS